ncbi:MAG: NAD(P)/FAD-dependent oxidoreductase [Acidobacteria bacterium]|nr:NAD(P)/FAD-dependent oxidoreductase [Acidobacteriota bacterium]MBW4044048.1 NAD(P)/FAD-dependent oxidoreductase [Acidobacteriota bacterium]
MNPRCCDVLVVGGGPAGLSAAIALRLQGADVVVAEALAPPIDKACGEGIMPDSRRDLAALGVELDRSMGAPFEGTLFAGAATGHQVAARFQYGEALGVRRLKLHALLIDRAEQLGVRLLWQTRVNLSDGAAPTINDEQYRYNYLIGADGQSSRVRRWAGLEEGRLISRRFGFRRHYAIAPWSRSVEVHWGDLGQAYITPVGESEICVAVITRHPRVHFDQVISGIPFLARRLSVVDSHTRQRGAITTTRSLRRVIKGNVALVGDASGSADAITGEGLAMGFRQATLLSQSIAAGNLRHYAAGHAGILRLPQSMSRAMLLMDRSSFLRDRALQMLAARPVLFQKMLNVHLGEEQMSHFVARHGLEMGWRLLVSPAS